MKILRLSLLFSLLLGTVLSLQATVVTLNPQSGTLQGNATFEIKREDNGQKIKTIPISISGNTFYGWYDAPIGGKRVYLNDGSPCPSDYFTYNPTQKTYVWKSELKTLTLYAHWLTTRISFDLRGGNNTARTWINVNSEGENADSKISVGTAGVRPGFTFLGWYSAPQGGEMVYDVEGRALEGAYWRKQNNQWYWQGGDYQFKLYAHWQADVVAKEDPDHQGDFYSTFYDAAMAYVIPDGVMAYTLEQNGDILKLNAIEGGVIPQNTGVILKSNNAFISLQPSAANVTAIDGNALAGMTGDAEQSQEQGYDYYMLSYGQHKLGFYKMTAGQKLAPHKAFIRLDAVSGSAKASFYGFAEDASALQVLNLDELPTSSSIYNLSGQRSGLTDPGIHIVNGRKVLRIL